MMNSIEQITVLLPKIIEAADAEDFEAYVRLMNKVNQLMEVLKEDVKTATTNDLEKLKKFRKLMNELSQIAINRVWMNGGCEAVEKVMKELDDEEEGENWKI